MQSNIVKLPARNPVTHLPVQRAPRSNEDPIFPVIEHHRALSAAYDAAVAHPGVGDDSPEFKAQNDLGEAIEMLAQSLILILRDLQEKREFLCGVAVEIKSRGSSNGLRQ
jgi:hypothetical protein